MVSQLLLYSMKSAMTLVMLYVPYMFMLQKEKFFRFNRRVLLGIIVISMVLPMLNISWLSVDDVPVVQATHQQMVGVGIPVNMGEYTIESEPSSLPTIESVRMPVSTTTSISWFDVLAIVFFMGMVISVIVRSFQLGILSYAMKHKILWKKKLENGIRICCRKGRFSPYSWMNTIVISEEDLQDGQHEIILHESGHILSHHSYDMLLLMVCQAVQWYNPFVWLMSRSLSEVHEYEADQYVLEQGVSSTEYMMLLLKKVAGKQNYSFVNGFNKNSIKQRILMMKQTAKSPWRRIKVIYVLPVCLVALCAFATQKVSAPLEEMLETLEASDAVNSIKESVEEITEIAENDSIAETVPTKIFTIEGTVDASITDSCYNVYISDDYFHINMDKPDMCVPVVDKKFRVEIPTDKVKAGRISRILPNGELRSDWDFYVVPEEVVYIAVHDESNFFWKRDIESYTDKIKNCILDIRKSNPSLKTPHTPHFMGNVWNNVERGLDNKSLYVNQVIFNKDATVLHIMTDDFYEHNNVTIWQNAHIEDEHGNKYELLRADVGRIGDNNSPEMRVYGGYFYFQPVREGTKILNFYNNSSIVPTISGIREGSNKKKKDNFELHLTVSEDWKDAEIEVCSANGCHLHKFVFDDKNTSTYSVYLNRPYIVYLSSTNRNKKDLRTWNILLMPDEEVNVDVKGEVVTINGSQFYNQFGKAYTCFSEDQKRIRKKSNKNNHSLWEFFKEHADEKGCTMFFDVNEIYSESTIYYYLKEPLRSSEYGKDLFRRVEIRKKREQHYVHQGNIQDFAQLTKAKTDEIESVTFVPDTAAIAKYGDKGKGGAIEIKTKKRPKKKSDSLERNVFTAELYHINILQY